MRRVPGVAIAALVSVVVACSGDKADQAAVGQQATSTTTSTATIAPAVSSSTTASPPTETTAVSVVAACVVTSASITLPAGWVATPAARSPTAGAPTEACAIVIPADLAARSGLGPQPTASEVLAGPELIAHSVYTSLLPAVPAGQGTGATFAGIAEEAARTAGARATVAIVDGLPQLADPAIKLTTKRNHAGVGVMRISYVVGPNPPGPQNPGDRVELLFFDLGTSGILEFFPSDSHVQTAEAMDSVANLFNGLVDRVHVAK